VEELLYKLRSYSFTAAKDQKKQLQDMKNMARNMARGSPPPGPFPGGPPNGPPPGPPGGGRGGPRGGPPGRFGPGGPPGLFRAPRYAPDYAGLAGKDLTPGKTIEVLQVKESSKKPKDKQAK